MAKKILLLTSASFSTHSTGISQTLENLFDGYPADKLLVCSPNNALGNFLKFTSIPYKNFILRNRWIKKISSKALIELYFKTVRIPRLLRKLQRYGPEVVLIANLDHQPGLILNALLLKKKISAYVYLLDDLLITGDEKIDNLYQRIINNARGHIFISKYMAEHNINRYPGIDNWIIAQNPVDAHQIAAKPIINEENQQFNIAYAGAIWDMHSDALFSFAAGLQILKKAGLRVKLSVYTTEYFFNKYQNEFSQFDIAYEGFVPFTEIKSKLSQYQALLVTSSFSESLKELTCYSVQTKITDYLACGVPVVSIGPEYSACNRFIEENIVGFCIKTNAPESVATIFNGYLNDDPSERNKLSQAGLELIRNKYTKDDNQKALYQFLNA